MLKAFLCLITDGRARCHAKVQKYTQGYQGNSGDWGGWGWGLSFNIPGCTCLIQDYYSILP